MPFNYAHYRFAADRLAAAPPEFRQAVARHRRLYDVGLHGPDIFMCRGPVLRRLAQKFHHQTGKAFFTRAVRSLRLESPEGGLAYLYGLLTHYCLDSVCHPFVNEQAAQGEATHVEIESEFDRFLLELDGKTPPASQDLSTHIRLTDPECETASIFYPGISPAQVGSCVANMALFAKVLSLPENRGRELLIKAAVLPGLDRFFMTDGPNMRCSHLNVSLLTLYHTAAAQFPAMLSQLQAHLRRSIPLGPEFDPIFG